MSSKSHAAKTAPLLAFMAIASLAPSCLAASDKPLFRPTRDVAISYRLTGVSASEPSRIEVKFIAVTQQTRVDFYHDSAAEAFGGMLVNGTSKTEVLLLNEKKAYVTQPYSTGPNLAFPLSDQMHFTPQGQQQIAGQPCRNWNFTGNTGSGVVCVTDDGVLLQAHRIAPVDREMTATAVTFAAQPGDAFQIPNDYQRWVIAPKPIDRPTPQR